ncbi:UNVERIFIED_CONTAM: hypothetical protein Sindi_3018100 [Sesamum indicum]
MHIQSFLLPQWKWFVDYANVGNRIWLAWDDNAIDVHILDLGEQYIHCRVMNRADSEIVIITVVYGASEVIGRRALWNSLQTLAPQCVDVPWLVGGDFNAVRDINEVCGISGDIRIAMEDFNNCIQEAGLLPMPMQAECVQNIWQHEVIGVPMYAVTRKLKALKLVFRQQRRNKGDLSHNVQLAKGFLDEAQNLQRAKMQWMKEGDQCSRVFFRKIAQRRAGRRILQINDENGSTHIEPEEVIHEFVSYYQNLLGGNRRQILVDINYLRPWARHIITNEEASHLCLPFTPKDVKNAVFDISEDKAPGPNGYSSGFFKAAWPVVGTEVTRAVLNFFTTGKLLKQVNSTLLALIPKVHNPMTVGDFRPISCCNVLYKIIAKLRVANSHTGTFVGNIPLQTTLDDCFGDDKIALAFNNSSRKTLSYVEPMRQNGEVVVRPSLDIVRDGSKRWKSTAVGYFLGKRPYYHHLKEYAHSVWPALREVSATANGFFFFQFKSVIDMDEVIEGGPWLFQGQPIVLQKWEPGMAMRKLKHTQPPVWIKLRHLPMEFWTTDGLSTVASGVGKPLYPDVITRACTRLDFARVCVMVDVSQNLPNHVIIMTPDEDGGETPCKVDVDYEWLPPKCLDCMTLGHSTKECPLTKPKKTTKPPVAVYVPKPFATRVTTEPVRVQKPRQDCAVVDGMKDGDNPASTRQDNRGKEVVIYNAFEALDLIDDTDEQSGGPNTRSPIGYDPC